MSRHRHPRRRDRSSFVPCSIPACPHDTEGRPIAGVEVALGIVVDQRKGNNDLIAPRPDNYDWKYLGGSNVSKFWRDFTFTFDPDELAFLRHGPWENIIPGGAEFHTIPYWENTDGAELATHSFSNPCPVWHRSQKLLFPRWMTAECRI